MTRTALVVGDLVADHLLPPLRTGLEDAGWQVALLDAHGVANAVVSATSTGVWVEGSPVDAVAFRLSLDLLAAPGFAEEDRSFVTNELRAFWAHVLCLPFVRTVNSGHAVAQLLRDPCAWRDLLGRSGVAVVAARCGVVEGGSWWLRPNGELCPPPTALVAQTLGALTLEAAGVRSVICCAGQIHEADGPLVRAAQILCAAGLGLAELLVDDDDRVLAVVPDPAIGPSTAPWASRTLVRWLDASPRW